jgi:hypothetical protein
MRGQVSRGLRPDGTTQSETPRRLVIDQQIPNALPDVCSCADRCSAPICPLVPGAGIWYVSEAVCRSRKHGAGLHWLRVQRRIARLGGVKGYFIFKELSSIRRVRRGIKGRDPDAPTDRRQNAPAQRRRASRDGVVRVDDGGLDSEPQAEPIPTEQGLSRVSDVPLDAQRE